MRSSNCTVYASIILILCILILIPSFIGVYWNVLTIILFSFSIWLLASDLNDKKSSAKLASLFLFGTSLFLLVLNIISIIVITIKKDWIRKSSLFTNSSLKYQNWVIFIIFSIFTFGIISVFSGLSYTCSKKAAAVLT